MQIEYLDVVGSRDYTCLKTVSVRDEVVLTMRFNLKLRD